jgi:hypothetical protein
VLLLDSTSFWRRQHHRQVPAVHLLAACGSDAETRDETTFDPWDEPLDD